MWFIYPPSTLLPGPLPSYATPINFAQEFISNATPSDQSYGVGAGEQIESDTKVAGAGRKDDATVESDNSKSGTTVAGAGRKSDATVASANSGSGTTVAGEILLTTVEPDPTGALCRVCYPGRGQPACQFFENMMVWNCETL